MSQEDGPKAWAVRYRGVRGEGDSTFYQKEYSILFFRHCGGRRRGMGAGSRQPA
jgi:hypothetical protein